MSSAVAGQVTRWRARYVDTSGSEPQCSFEKKGEAQRWLDAHGLSVALVEPEALRAHLANVGATGATERLAEEAAATASAYVSAFCSRLRPGEPVPPVVARVALALATRLASNPRSVRSVSTEGQSADLAPTGLTYLESLLLAPYRRRSA